VFDAMMEGWCRQQRSRRLSEATIRAREQLVRRFVGFTGEYPWRWGPGDVEDFTTSLVSGPQRHAVSTVRGYQTTLRLFCDYLTDTRYEWVDECRRRFDAVPSQVCHEWNTVAHLSEYEGRPERRPLTYDELQALFDHADARVDCIAATGRKGALAALRDAQMFKTAYAFGLRRHELVRLDVADLRPNPHVKAWGRFGSLHVRYGKAIKGGQARRRTVLAVPEFDWALQGLHQWVEHARDRFGAGAHPALWVTERASRVSVRHVDERFAQLRDQAGPGPRADTALPAPLLCHPPGGVRLPGAVRAGAGGSLLRVDHGDLHVGQQRLQEPGVGRGVEPRLLADRRSTVTKKMTIRWQLRQVMATRGMFQTTDLAAPLAERGVHLSREQIFRLVTKTPQRLNMDVLAALCDILDCGPDDLIEVVAEPRQGTKTGSDDNGPGIGDLRPVRARVRRPHK
jgi:DNA-binding Xre family transcriptional regulator/integrase